MAAGVDTHPGDARQLHDYWVHGKGRAKWNSWTELHHHLLKYLPPDEAKRTAAQWYHEGTGMWAGSDLNRVAHGHPPRGKRIGRG